MNLLAIESSTEQLSVALLSGGQLLAREASEPRRHAALLLQLVDGLLGEAGIGRRELDAIAFGCGPGAFTGVRLATSSAQGLGFGLDRPVLPVSSLKALALAATRSGAVPPLLTVLDARMGELYAAAWCQEDDRELQRVGEEELVSPAGLQLPGDDVWCVVGSGWHAHREALEERFGMQLQGLDEPRLPHAREIALVALADYRAGARPSAFEAMPVYLRDKVAQTTAERLAAKRAA
jgi:tRNA threonylcarbamoyladenosine biosynthesis protein TsaB